MTFYIKNLYFRRSFILNKDFIIFDYFNGYRWKHLRSLAPDNFDFKVSTITNLIISLLLNKIEKTFDSLDDYNDKVKFFEVAYPKQFENTIKLWR